MADIRELLHDEIDFAEELRAETKDRVRAAAIHALNSWIEGGGIDIFRKTAEAVTMAVIKEMTTKAVHGSAALAEIRTRKANADS